MFSKKQPEALSGYVSPFRPLSADEQAKFEEIYQLALEADKTASEAFGIPAPFKIEQRAADGLWHLYSVKKPKCGMHSLRRFIGKSRYVSDTLVSNEEEQNYNKRELTRSWERGDRPVYYAETTPMGKKISEYTREGFTSRKLAEKFLHDYLNPIKERRLYDKDGKLLSVEPIEIVTADMTSSPEPHAPNPSDPTP